MDADIITIGDEILIGQVVDTNSAWLGQQLHQYGIEVRQIKSISDKADAICEAIEHSKSSVIIITGGLGPTNDDITKTTLTQYFNAKLIFNEAVYADIKKMFDSMGLPVNELNKQQAMLPDKAKILPNKNGTAAGMWFTRKEQHIISLPGVPYEMKSIVSDYLLPKLSQMYQLKPIYFKTIMTVGVAESVLAERLSEWEKSLPDYIKLAYLPRPGMVRLRLSIEGEYYQKNEDEIDRIIDKLKSILPEETFSFEDNQIQDEVARLLTQLGKTVATAESCTGGNIAGRLTSIAGSSAYYKGSVVAYSNEIKEQILNVDASDLEQYGAVSEQVVKQMASQVRIKMNSDFGIATSGIAGPDRGTESKPVGTTWIAVASEKGTFAECFSLGHHRGRNIDKACIYALNMLRLMIKLEA